MSEHCETCQFWGNDGDTEEYRKCSAVVHDQREIHMRSYYPEEYHKAEERRKFVAAHLAVVVDGSGYWAALLPRREFGCVLHKEKT